MERLCPECGTMLASDPEGPGACPACMLELGLEDMATRSADGAPTSAGRPRLFPGAMVVGRYRIVSLLGRGGMGEVYRADDLKLGQPVALKFLRTGRDAGAPIESLLREVRLARQVSHPNVCRVYDIGEVDDVHFLSMEYVDGEDLATLLRRVGHVPPARALQVARQLCAGLAAAHGQGILHRDLKPGNVMIDGHGRAKITDFGLAEIDRDAGAGTIVGTPSYMAPEQAARGEASVRSDLYSLGLVLHELFTGERVFDAETPAEMRRLQRESTLPTPSSRVDGIDPVVDRAIRRCLEADPSDRPSSALAVAASLPGGDALEAALAAGETPPPEVVAATGGDGAMRPATALLCLAATVIGIGLVAWWSGRNNLYARGGPAYPPQVMTQKARDIVASLGHDEPPTDEAWQFFTDFDYLYHLRETDESTGRWDRLSFDRPTAMGFWYRRSPESLIPLASRSQVAFHDPPRTVPGMIDVRLDARGRLTYFAAVPERHHPSGEDGAPVDWEALLRAAGLRTGDLTPRDPEWAPPSFGDQRMAWTGTYPDQVEPTIRVEAAAYRGRPTHFEIVHPWTRADDTDVLRGDPAFRATQIVVWAVFFSCAAVAGVLARRNLKAGRGDRRAAFRVASFIVVTRFLHWIVTFHHVPSVRDELGHAAEAFSFSLLLGFVVWLMYVALEPFARRVWPQLLISWSRLVSGRLRDPLVGRHALCGALVGVLAAGLERAGSWTAAGLGHPPEIPAGGTFPGSLAGMRVLFGEVLSGLSENLLIFPMFLLFVLVGLRYLLRGRVPAMIAFVAFGLVLALPSVETWTVHLPFVAGVSALSLFAYTRLGFVGAVAFWMTASLGSHFPLTLDPSAWYFSYSLASLLLPVGVVAYAFRIALGGRPWASAGA